MAAVNGKREIDEKEYKNPCTDCHDNKIEQNDLEELKAVKINKINRKIKPLRKKAKENKKSDEKDWKSTYLEWIAVLPVGGFQLLADVLVKNIWKSLAILLLGIFILKKIEHSAVCYENAAEYGDALCKKEAEKMKAAAKDNWASFKNWVP